MIGGAIFNLANLLLVAAIDMAGLAIAFPVSIGIALVVGVISSYAIQPKGNAALACDRRDLRFYRGRSSTERPTAAWRSPAARSRKKSIIVCIVSGVLMGLVGSLRRHGAMTNGNTLGPYSVAVFLTLGALLSCLIWNIYFMKKPLVGEPVSFAGFFSGPVSGHAARIASADSSGAPAWCSTSSPEIHGVAISYAIGQSAPMVGRPVGNFCLERICRRTGQSETVLDLDVCLLCARNPAGSESQRLNSCFLEMLAKRECCHSRGTLAQPWNVGTTVNSGATVEESAPFRAAYASRIISGFEPQWSAFARTAGSFPAASSAGAVAGELLAETTRFQQTVNRESGHERFCSREVSQTAHSYRNQKPKNRTALCSIRHKAIRPTETHSPTRSTRNP